MDLCKIRQFCRNVKGPMPVLTQSSPDAEIGIGRQRVNRSGRFGPAMLRSVAEFSHMCGDFWAFSQSHCTEETDVA